MSKLTALITGASGGIGLEFARIHAAYKYDLVLVARNETKLSKIRAEIEKEFGVTVWIFPADLTLVESIPSLLEFIEKKNIRVNHLINNAGIGVYGKFHETTMEANKKLIDLNINALVSLTHAIGEIMVKNGSGKILNVASTAAFMPGPYMSVYFASKAFVLSFGEAVNMELEGTGVRVTTLCPGPTETGFEDETDGMKASGLFSKQKVASPRDVAKDGYFAMMNNQSLIISGSLNKAATFFIRFTPRSLLNTVTKSILKPVN